MKHPAVSLLIAFGLIFPLLNGDARPMAVSCQKDNSAPSPNQLTPQEGAVPLDLSLAVKRLNVEIRIAKRHGLIVQMTMKTGRDEVNCNGIDLSVRQGAVRVLVYDAKGNRQSARVALSSEGYDSAFLVPKQPGIWVVSKELITEFTGKVQPESLLYLIRTRNGTVRVVDVATGETVWVPSNARNRARLEQKNVKPKASVLNP